jgi:beta-galactosidase
MQPITFDRICYRIDGKPVYLNSGEFHYFRVPKADWRARMELLKQAGGNCVATYVPWAIHEPEEGRFVFGEADYTDLEGFLQTAAEAGLYVIARPGPYQYSELLYHGLPPWLCDNHPELLARELDGRIINVGVVSYLHPLFVEKARGWFDQVAPILARYTVGRGGPIAFTQVDNELIGIHIWFGSLDYTPATMGFGQPEGRFTRFLQARYAGDLAALNTAYGLQAGKFEEVPPAPMHGGNTLPDLRRRKDYYEFYLGTVAEYAKLLADWLAEHGVDTPIVHNSANPEMNAMFLETAEMLGPNFILGSDHYYNLDQNWAQNSPTPQYARKVFASLEMLRLMGYPPTVYEMPGGSLADWPPITSIDAKACYLTNLALGMKGHNYYIFTGGPNPPGAGSTGDLYDYNAGIGADGEVRPLYQAQKEFGLFAREHPWLAEAEREGDCRFALDWDMARSPAYWRERGDFLLGGAEAWRFLLDGPLTTAFCASLSPVFCDLNRDDWTTDLSTPVVVVTSPVMAAARQQRIVRFLEAGGRALILPVWPEYDEAWQPCTILRDSMGGTALEAGDRRPVRLTIAGAPNVMANGDVYFGGELPAGAEVIGVEERSHRVIGWSVRTERVGEAIFLGFRWTHAVHEHAQMLAALLARLGLQQTVECSNPNVWTSLRSVEGHSMLFLLNLFTAPMEATVRCRPAWAGEMLHTGHHIVGPMSVERVEIG